MDVGIVVFAYNRAEHLKKVLEGLAQNTGVAKIYVFQDGLRSESDRIGWETTRKIIEDIDWCEVVSVFSDKNKGLANSIVEGINYVLMENDAVIVLEDDCVPAADFINFMYQCFEKYQHNRQIYAVSGYSWPIQLEENNKSDVYFCGRMSSWGWGTWKDRWKEYERDFDILRNLKMSRIGSRNLGIWGNDLEQILVDNVKGQSDSWAVFWALKIIEREGKCINPYHNLIENIGFDGSGVHCGANDEMGFGHQLINDKGRKYLLPEECHYEDVVVEKFLPICGSYTAFENLFNGKKRVLVWGTGNCFKRHEKEINEKFWIEAFIDNYKKGYYVGKPILKPKDIYAVDYKYIIIMIEDHRIYELIKGQLMDMGIHEDIIYSMQ